MTGKGRKVKIARKGKKATENATKARGKKGRTKTTKPNQRSYLDERKKITPEMSIKSDIYENWEDWADDKDELVATTLPIIEGTVDEPFVIIDPSKNEPLFLCIKCKQVMRPATANRLCYSKGGCKGRTIEEADASLKRSVVRLKYAKKAQAKQEEVGKALGTGTNPGAKNKGKKTKTGPGRETLTVGKSNGKTAKTAIDSRQLPTRSRRKATAVFKVGDACSVYFKPEGWLSGTIAKVDKLTFEVHFPDEDVQTMFISDTHEYKLD